MFSFEWAELQQALEKLAASPAQRERVQSFVGGIRKNATSMSRSETLGLIAVAALLTQHEDPNAYVDLHQVLSTLH